MSRVYIDFSNWNTRGATFFGGGEYYTCQIINLIKKNTTVNLTVLFRKGTEGVNEIQKGLFSDKYINILFCEKFDHIDYSRCDVLFQPGPFNKEVCLGLIRIHNKFPKLRIIFTLHDFRRHDLSKYDPYDNYFYKYSFLSQLCHIGFNYLKWIIYKAYIFPQLRKSVDYFMTVSNYSMQLVEKYVKPRRIGWFYQSVNMDNLSSNEDDLTMPNEYILFVSGGRPEKNLLRALKAYGICVENGETNYDLVITGTNQTTEQIVRKSHAINTAILSDKVKFLGYVSESSIQKLYSECKFLLYTSKSEGFGIPALNAGIYGTPVIASGKTAIPEVLGSAAYYVNPYDINSIRDGIKSFSQAEIYEKYREYAKDSIPLLVEMMNMGMERMADVILGKS